MGNMIIRNVRDTDIERIQEIYAYYVEYTAISFEYKAPTVDEFRRRIEKIQCKYPFLVCEIDDVVVGYVYASAYSGRDAYDWTVTTSIYIDKNIRRQGVGSALYRALEEKLKEQGIVNTLAAIAYIENEDEYLTNDSYLFHLKQGYTKVAHMPNIGKKFDIWYDLIWMQKVL